MGSAKAAPFSDTHRGHSSWRGLMQAEIPVRQRNDASMGSSVWAGQAPIVCAVDKPHLSTVAAPLTIINGGSYMG
jgi:hypothetical protein